MSQDKEKRVIRNYNVTSSTHQWMDNMAKAQGRSLIKQVEVILEAARNSDETAGK